MLQQPAQKYTEMLKNMNNMACVNQVNNLSSTILQFANKFRNLSQHDKKRLEKIHMIDMLFKYLQVT